MRTRPPKCTRTNFHSSLNLSLSPLPLLQNPLPLLSLQHAVLSPSSHSLSSNFIRNKGFFQRHSIPSPSTLHPIASLRFSSCWWKLGLGLFWEMEKESSRRPAIREPATKRPKVPEGGDRNGGSNGTTANRDLSVPPFSAPNGSGQELAPKPGAGTKEASKKLESNQQQQEEGDGVEELMTQYRSALLDLTSNSRPIITNLSIIAGENLHAAKEIAEIICDNILAVTRLI